MIGIGITTSTGTRTATALGGAERASIEMPIFKASDSAWIEASA
jgi:hypothetical protein